MNLNKFVRAYFYTTIDAQKAIRQLEPYFKCSEPMPVPPVNGRTIFVLIEIPEASLPQPQFPNAILNSQILQIVLTYNGIVREKTEFNR